MMHELANSSVQTADELTFAILQADFALHKIFAAVATFDVCSSTGCLRTTGRTRQLINLANCIGSEIDQIKINQYRGIAVLQ